MVNHEALFETVRDEIGNALCIGICAVKDYRSEVETKKDGQNVLLFYIDAETDFDDEIHTFKATIDLSDLTIDCIEEEETPDTREDDEYDRWVDEQLMSKGA